MVIGVIKIVSLTNVVLYSRERVQMGVGVEEILQYKKYHMHEATFILGISYSISGW